MSDGKPEGAGKEPSKEEQMSSHSLPSISMGKAPEGYKPIGDQAASAKGYKPSTSASN